MHERRELWRLRGALVLVASCVADDRAGRSSRCLRGARRGPARRFWSGAWFCGVGVSGALREGEQLLREALFFRERGQNVLHAVRVEGGEGGKTAFAGAE